MDLVTLAVAKKYTRDQIAEAAVGGVDVTEYVNERVDELIGGASGTFDTLGEIETTVKNKVDKVSGKGLSTNDFTNDYKSKVDSAVPTSRTINNKALSANISLTASDVNAVPTTRTVNGKALSGNITLSAEDVNALPSSTTIPTALADLTEDATHRVVTDAEKTAWNAKSNFSGSYNDLTNKPTIPSIDGLATTTYVDNAVANIVLTSASGNKFTLSVADDGTLTAVAVTE
ncbi:MAG: hypothetical protein UHD64_02940 [Bacteroidales bacterium]|nr:hypothetical protein [Bacteroidales bacterium]